MRDSDFLERWERQRRHGFLVYALVHALIIGIGMGALYLVFNVTELTAPERFTPKTITFFMMGGFAYGLIRFNLRERFYNAMKGVSDD